MRRRRTGETGRTGETVSTPAPLYDGDRYRFTVVSVTDPARLRDSTRIVLPSESLDGICEDLEAQFTVTVIPEDAECRIIGSPTEIKAVNDFLTRHGVSLP